MNKIDTEWLGLVDLPVVITGILLLFGGWLIYWTSLSLLGAILFGGLMFLVSEPILEMLNWGSSQETILRYVLVIIGAIGGLFIFRLAHKVAFFITGFIAGAIGWWVALEHLRLGGQIAWVHSDLALAFGAPVAGLLVGLLVMASDRALIALATALAGAGLIQMGIEERFSGFLVLPLALVGFAVQMLPSLFKSDKNEQVEE